MLNTLKKIASIEVVILFLIANLVFPLLLFPHYVNEIRSLCGIKKFIGLDSMRGYDVAQLTKLFDSMNKDSCHHINALDIYETIVCKIDMVFPFIYASFGILALVFLIKNIWPQKDKLLYLSFFPLLGTIADFIENNNTSRLIKIYLEAYEKGQVPDYGCLVEFASSVTITKQVLLVMAAGLIGILLIVLTKISIESLMQKKLLPEDENL